MADFCAGLGPLLEKQGVAFDRLGQPLLACHTGDASHRVHIDNPHEEGGLPDNGMRVSCTYFINPQWDPEGEDQAPQAALLRYLAPEWHGHLPHGLLQHLERPEMPPREAPHVIRSSFERRVASHMDTLVLHLSERIVHQMLPTAGAQRWYSLQLWALDGVAMQQMSRKLLAMRTKEPESDDD